MKPIHPFVLLLFSTEVCAQPTITRHPTNISVSLGANAIFRITATSTAPPITYQWRFNGLDLAGGAATSLTVTNVQMSQAGDYSVVAMDSFGSTTSHVAQLDIDSTFIKITTGPVVTSGGYSFGSAWGDYDNDGFIDLFVANSTGDSSFGKNFLYLNNRDGEFTRITTGGIVTDAAWNMGGAWGDADNDGHLDLLVFKINGVNSLYLNQADGTFVSSIEAAIAKTNQYSHGGSWGDSNNDGWLDFVLANTFGRTDADPPKENVIYRNTGAAGFVQLPFKAKPLGTGNSWQAIWGDCNNDGKVDLFVANGGWISKQRNDLYRNEGNGSFTQVTTGVLTADLEHSAGCAWGDYDNDGDLDLFIAHLFGQNNALYRNDGGDNFTRIMDSVVGNDGGSSTGCAWADYDNDGWLDLFVSNFGLRDAFVSANWPEEHNFLYHNNGDGTFTKILSGSVVNDLGYSTGCAWGDYDNDGFPDLLIANGHNKASQDEFLYRNNGNKNSWINLKLVGLVSNQAAIGAKVRVKATIGGRSIWQMREISGGSGYGSQNDLRTNFGLGTATNAELIRIEWPSGTVQELRGVLANQFHTIIEPPRVSVAAQSSAAKISVRGGVGFAYVLEGSTDLVNWLPIRTNTASGVTTEFEDAYAANLSSRFYRARLLIP